MDKSLFEANPRYPHWHPPHQAGETSQALPLVQELLNQYRFIRLERRNLQEELQKTQQELLNLKSALIKTSLMAFATSQDVLQYVINTDEQVGFDSNIEPNVENSASTSIKLNQFWETMKAGKVWRDEIITQDERRNWRVFDTLIVPISPTKGSSEQYLVLRYENTTCKMIDQALQSSEAKNKSLLKAIPDLMFRLNQHGMILDYYPAQDNNHLPQNPDIIGQRINYVFPVDLAEWTLHYLQQTLTTGEIQVGEYVFQQNSQWLHYEARYVPSGSEEVLVMVRDITERKQAEAKLRVSEIQERERALQLEQALKDLKQTQSQLIQAEKMSSLGQMIAGIAHEINNPITFISGNLLHIQNYISSLLGLTKLYQENYPEPVTEIQEFADSCELEFLMEDATKVLNSVQLGTNRIRELVLSLRNFSRLDEAEKKPVDIHEGIDSTLMILQNRFKGRGQQPTITLLKEYGDLPLVDCYPSQLNQVFMNILANAIDALEESSEAPVIKIKTELYHSKNNCPTPDAVRILIEDNGPGIPEDVKKRLFDPFFTTKPIGKGTGLGLSISYKIIVEKHKGQLNCFSQVGKGTTFEIMIPWESKN